MPLFADPTPDAQFPAMTNYITFQSEGVTLNGRFFVAQGEGAHPTILLLHGYPGIEQNFDLAQALRRVGWHVIAFHYRGAWGSEGIFSVEHALEDVLAVLNTLHDETFAAQHRIDREKLIVIGHSMGGFIALWAASQCEFVRGVVSLAGFNFGAHAQLLTDDPDDLEYEAALWNQEVAPLKGAAGMALVEEMVAHKHDWDISTFAPTTKANILLVMGAQDPVCPLPTHYDAPLRAYQQAGVSITGKVINGDHSFANSRVLLTETVGEWLETIR
jgi:uncharacterized protein